jgi:hypothetical protein
VVRSGRTIIVTTCDAQSDKISAELSRQLGNWAIEAKTHSVGGSNTGFNINADPSTVNGNGLKWEKTFSPAAWLLEKAYEESVFKPPFLYGCQDALVCEVLSPTDYNEPKKDGSQTVSTFKLECCSFCEMTLGS